MIISCPSCTTRYDLPANRLGADGTMIKCASCGYSWLESRAIEITTTPMQQLPAVVEHGFEPDSEVRRLVEANREAQATFVARRKLRNKRIAGWSGLGVAVLSPFVFAAAAPATVVALAPASIVAYEALGIGVNIYGLYVRQVEMQHMVMEGTRVLAIKGEIVNVSSGERKIPSLRFGLKGDKGAEVYSWTLDSGARPLKPGESTSFVTRVASPPDAAKNVEIRFARADEIGSTPQP